MGILRVRIKFVLLQKPVIYREFVFLSIYNMPTLDVIDQILLDVVCRIGCRIVVVLDAELFSSAYQYIDVLDISIIFVIVILSKAKNDHLRSNFNVTRDCPYDYYTYNLMIRLINTHHCFFFDKQVDDEREKNFRNWFSIVTYLILCFSPFLYQYKHIKFNCTFSDSLHTAVS